MISYPSTGRWKSVTTAELMWWLFQAGETWGVRRDQQLNRYQNGARAYALLRKLGPWSSRSLLPFDRNKYAWIISCSSVFFMSCSTLKPVEKGKKANVKRTNQYDVLCSSNTCVHPLTATGRYFRSGSESLILHPPMLLY